MSEKNQSTLTYEKLFNLLRSEKSDLKIQSIPQSYITDAVSYLQLKTASLESSKSSDLFSEEQLQAEQQLRNAQRIVQDIYDRREKKILTLAINKSRSAKAMVDTSSLLPVEQELLYDIVSVLLKYRKNVLLEMIQLREPTHTQEESVKQTTTKPSQEQSDELDALEAESIQRKTVEILEDIPEMIGPDMQKYGPYIKGSQVDLSEKIATVLEKKGQIKIIS